MRCYAVMGIMRSDSFLTVNTTPLILIKFLESKPVPLSAIMSEFLIPRLVSLVDGLQMLH
jgi:hypothetical protein